MSNHRELKMKTPAVAMLEPTPGKTASSVYDHSWWILDADVSGLFHTIGKTHIRWSAIDSDRSA